MRNLSRLLALHCVTEISQCNSVFLDTEEIVIKYIVKSKYLPKLLADNTQKINSLFMEKEWVQSGNQRLGQQYLQVCS